MTTCASGKCNIPPFIIHSRPGNDDPDLSLDDCSHLFESTDGHWKSCSGGIDVSVSSSGPMTRVLFPQFVKHFIRNLPASQGKGKEPVFLFLDGHTSRWSYQGLSELKENNVHVISLPSHTSIFSPPNDAGVNASFKHFYADAVAKWRSTHAPVNYGKMQRDDFNQIFGPAYMAWSKMQEERLAASGCNAITSAWNNVGLITGDRNNEFWTRAIATIG